MPNRNLGGAGGFARGLMELRDERWATHVLFMDDDVTFEPEVVGRIAGVLAFARDAQLCISGGMLREEYPNRQFEAGARIASNAVHIWQVNGSDYDLTDPEEDDLLDNEADEHIDYGGWWCFAFPIDLTDDYPLPVFVRGDDVCFGLKYCAGRTIAMNGIGVWHQDFAHKNGPVAFFYEARNIPLVLSIARDDYKAGALRKRVVDRTLRFSAAFKYESAEAVLDGTEAFLDGPDRLLAKSADELNAELRGRYGERIEPLAPDSALDADVAAAAATAAVRIARRIAGDVGWAPRPTTVSACGPVGGPRRHDAGDGAVGRRGARVPPRRERRGLRGPPRSRAVQGDPPPPSCCQPPGQGGLRQRRRGVACRLPEAGVRPVLARPVQCDVRLLRPQFWAGSSPQPLLGGILATCCRESRPGSPRRCQVSRGRTL